MPKFRNGRAPGHGQDNALDAFEAWLHSADTALDAFEAWLYASDLLNRNGIPEPTSKVEIDPESHEISFLLVWRAKDIVPGCELAAMTEDEKVRALAKRFSTLVLMLDAEPASGVEIDPESHEISFLLVWRAKDIAPVFEPGELAAMKAMADDEVMDTLAKRFGTLAAMLDDGSDDGSDTRH